MKNLQLSFFVLLGIFIGASAFTFYYGKGYSYLSDDPGACMNCHVMDEFYRSWELSSHRDVGCNECHLPHGFVRQYAAKANNGLLHATAFTFSDPQVIRLRDGGDERISRNCIRCHAATVAFVNRGGGQLCTDCHKGVGHPLQYQK